MMLSDVMMAFFVRRLMFDSNDLISLNSYTLHMLNALILVLIALVAVVGGFVLISNYVMPHIHLSARTS